MSKSLKSFIIFIIIILLVIFIIPKKSISVLTIRELLVFFLIGGVCIIRLIKEFKYASYSLNIMHWLFVLFFFVIAPIIQLSAGYYPWEILQSRDEIFNACIFVIIWILGYIFGNYIGKKYKISHNSRKRNLILHTNLIPYKISLILTILSFFCLLILIGTIGITNMFSRATAVVNYDGANSKMIILLINMCTRAFVVYSLTISIINYQKNKKYKFLMIINILILFLSCFPTSLARNITATIYIGILLVFEYKNIEKFKKSLKYICIFILAFMVIFPAITTYRIYEFADVNLIQIISKVSQNITQNYLSEDYDAFSLIVDTDRYVKNNGSTNGRQLMGAMLFFVPRSIWKHKPYRIWTDSI